MSRYTPFVLLLACMVAVGTGCQKDDKHDSKKVSKAAAKGATLWSRLGGEPAVRAVVKEFVARGAANPKVNFTRVGKPNEWKPTPKDLEKLEQRLVEFISSATGGPLKYTGKAMEPAHKGMEITDAEFDALAGDLIGALKKYKVRQGEIDELVAIVGTTRAQIVGK